MLLRRLAFLFAIPVFGACRDATGPVGEGPDAFVSVAAGANFTCALRRDGSAWCWGQAVFGQLGDGTTTPRLEAVRVMGGRTFRSLSAGSDHACAVAADSTAWCWGLNDFSELGAVTSFCNDSFRFFTCSSEPVQVSGTLRFAAISVGSYATCAVARDAEAGGSAFSAWCWGWNTRGEAGSGMPGSVIDEPALVAGGPALGSVSLHQFHACGASAGGALSCWGLNSYGQLAADTVSTPRCIDGPATGLHCAPTPLAAAAGLAVRAVSTGGYHTCVLDGAGLASCFGSNEYGVLGSPNGLGGATPVLADGFNAFRSISSGLDHTCAVTTSGQAWCWGLNTDGQLGVPSLNEMCPAFGTPQSCRRSPAQVAGVPALNTISAGFGHTCGVSREGEVWCWGRGAEGQLGDGAATSGFTPVRMRQAAMASP